MPLRLDACEMKDVLRKALDALQPLLMNLRVDVTAPEGLVELRADESFLERILGNLIGNAAKFTPAGGELRVAISASSAGVRVEVADSGPGIPEEHRSRIFEKLGQAEIRREHRKYSTGLGLAFCRLAVEAHGGRIGVESEVGKGSTFWFELPAGEGRAA
jgi:signal transduction histidine kinase